jgi:hypothetical protein
MTHYVHFYVFMNVYKNTCVMKCVLVDYEIFDPHGCICVYELHQVPLLLMGVNVSPLHGGMVDGWSCACCVYVVLVDKCSVYEGRTPQKFPSCSPVLFSCSVLLSCSAFRFMRWLCGVWCVMVW